MRSYCVTLTGLDLCKRGRPQTQRSACLCLGVLGLRECTRQAQLNAKGFFLQFHLSKTYYASNYLQFALGHICILHWEDAEACDSPHLQWKDYQTNKKKKKFRCNIFLLLNFPSLGDRQGLPV